MDILRHRSAREQMATSMATGVTRSWTMAMSCSTSTCHNRVTGGLGVAEVCLPLGSGAANLRTWEFQNLAQTSPLRFGATCWRCWSHFNSIELLSTPSSFVYAKPCQALAAICCNTPWFWCRYRRYLLLHPSPRPPRSSKAYPYLIAKTFPDGLRGSDDWSKKTWRQRKPPYNMMKHMYFW